MFFLKSDHVGRWVGGVECGRWHHPTLFLGWGILGCHCSGGSYWKMNNLPSSVLGPCQISALNLSVPVLLACPAPQFFCVLSLWAAEIQTSKPQRTQ